MLCRRSTGRACALLLVVGLAGRAAADPLVIDAPAGVLRGTTLDDMEVWLGIPYARPPLADVRWRAPQPLPR